MRKSCLNGRLFLCMKPCSFFQLFILFLPLIKVNRPMKKLAYLGSTLLCVSALALTGCEDDSPPSITLNGDAHTIHPLGAAYSDAGATASDNKDESVYVISDYSAVNPKHPNTDIAGDYDITYTAQGRAGNISTAIRTVSVTYTMWHLYHNYNVTDICL